MEPFGYRNGALHAENVPLAAIAERVGTPFYCYSSGAMTAAYRRLAEALAGLDATICYALKANSNQAVIATFAGLGAGADVVSEGEMRRALAAGVPPERIIFSGVGKTPAEIAAALDAGILQLNIESEPELETVADVARARGVTARVALRVNPDVDARTHAKITTGRKENKFGVDLARAPALYARAVGLEGVEPVGLAIHIGSQLTEIAPFEAAFRRMRELVEAIRAAGLPVRHLDLGGGIGVRYRGEAPVSLTDYAAAARRTIGDLGCRITVEPGRLLVGEAGVLVARVIYVKHGAAKTFVIVDAAMNDLIRPTLYEAYHAVEPVVEPSPGSPVATVDVVGPVCESGDYLALAREMALPRPGDLLALRSAGAYGAVMSSMYNTRPLISEVMVRDADLAVIRPRPDLESIIAMDRLPDWLAEPGGSAAGGRRSVG